MSSDLTDPVSVLSRTMYGEARGEGREGMIAVGWVPINRANHPRWWGSSIVSVCLDPWQFSTWNADDPNRATVLAVTEDDPIYHEAVELAAQIIAGTIPDPTLGADSYYATSMRAPSWAMRARFCIQIGHQRFFRVELPAPQTASVNQPYGHPDAPCFASHIT